MARRASLPSLVAVSITFYVVLVTTLFFAIVHRTGGTFVYALDDPYIHLAMAEQIAHGHYGINPLEASSPSSSILWPLLLTPLSGSPLQAYLPLAWNLIFGLVSGGLIGVFVERLPGFGKGESRRMLWLQKVAIVVLLIFVANLASLTFLGMEHVLQIMLAICCAIAMVDALQGRSIPVWCLAAAVIGPSVRYENLALTVAIAIALAGLRQTRKAVVVLALAVTPLIAFGIFLRARGLPMLPISVLMKRSANVNPMAPDLGAVRTFLYNLSQDVRTAERGSLVLLLVILIAIFLRDRVRMHRFVLAGTAVVAVAQLVVGKFGWFHRYQVYALIFVSMVMLRLAMEDRKVRFMHVAAVLFFCAAPFLRGTSLTPLAAAEVFEQQYQMHRFEAEFYRHDVAVNDLGLVSYQRGSDAYVLDVYGLASPEVFRATDRDSEWLDDIVARHGVHLAMLYPEWFDVPETWAPLAEMCRREQIVITGMPCVTFYSTSAKTAEGDRADVARFAATVPSSVSMTVYPANYREDQ